MSNIDLSEIRNTTRFPPVGQCIYCGSRNKLSDEHIVPFALGGRLILPKASCPECAKITSAFERKVLHAEGFMQSARVVGKFQTRRPKRRPKKVLLTIKKAQEFESIELPIEHATAFLDLPMLPRAAFLDSRPPVKGVTIYGMETIYFGKAPQEVATNLGAREIQDAVNLDATSFVRMIAKIGYGFAIGTQGLFPTSESPVIPLILGSADDGSTWVGSADYRLNVEDKKPMHALGLVSQDGILNGGRITVLVARVKLFASSGATGYEVVVRRKARD
jgi:hypothetical protein